MDKFTRKYMKLAKTLAEDNDACYSRKIAVILVSKFNTIISSGYNGPPSGIPHNDTEEYLLHLYDDMLQANHKEYLKEKHDCSTCESFVSKFAGGKECPRRILGISSGEQLYLCSCCHAERNALAFANRVGVPTDGATMYCYCSVPCHECTNQIIQANIKKVVCLKSDTDYSLSSRWLLKEKNIPLEEYEEQDMKS